MKRLLYSFSILSTAFIIASCGNAGTAVNGADTSGKAAAGGDTSTHGSATSINTVEDALAYSVGNTGYKGFVAYDKARTGKRPIVLVVPEWWGLTEYPRMRAKMLSDLGYFAVVVDMYGNGKVAENPKDAQAYATPFYTNPQSAKNILDAARAKAAGYAEADTANVAAIGYCFGGSMVLNYAKLGSPLKGVVSFHGDLNGVPPQKGLAAPVLVCHGAADDFVPPATVAAFKKSMDSAGAAYTFKTYAGATHAFTNPGATATGQKFKMPIQYNGAADTASWNDMKAFFATHLK